MSDDKATYCSYYTHTNMYVIYNNFNDVNLLQIDLLNISSMHEVSTKSVATLALGSRPKQRLARV
jgi:hypothetical protein